MTFLNRGRTLLVSILLLGTLVCFAQGMLLGREMPRFESDVLPIFQLRCLACHGENLQQNGLDLRTRDRVLQGGQSGPALVPGSAAESLLFEQVSSGTMPMGGNRLSGREIELIRHWIDSGALKEGETAEDAPPPLQASLTETDIMVPVVHVKCIVCHGKQIQKGGLDLRSRAGMLKGGVSGQAMVPGDPENSLLLQRIASGEMPPPDLQFPYFVRAVTSDELQKLRDWIAAGAPGEPEKAAEHQRDPPLSEKERDFWAFKPPRRPVVPEAGNRRLVRNPIDAFLLKRLEAQGLAFSPESEAAILMRRVYLDLIGLLPDPQEVEAFLEDPDPQAYEKMVDGLLDSRHYGERWGQHWLNAAGYADSEGGAADDLFRPYAYRYRDYVIRSLNADKPYDRFLMEQIAGDELLDYKAIREPTRQQLDTLVATGFLRMTPDPTNSHDVNFVPNRLDTVAGVVEMMGSTLMGLTLGCARCHSHKFDPIPQQDYYRFNAILRTSYDPYDWLLPNRLTGASFKDPYAPQRHLAIVPEAERQQAKKHNEPIEKEIERLEKSLQQGAEPFRRILLAEKLAQIPASIGEDVREAVSTPAEKRTKIQQYLLQKFTVEVSNEELTERFDDFNQLEKKIKEAIAEAKKRLKPEPKLRVLFDMGGEPTPTYILQRGDPSRPAPVRVEPGVPALFSNGIEEYRVIKPGWSSNTSGRRLALARWLVQPGHPLTARVMVNRMWQHHFGRGLVATPGNFGRTGEKPSHPELLDWLATEFVRQKWSMKAMHRLIVTTAAYRQSSGMDPQSLSHDPDGRLLSRFPLRRMDAEVIRDSILKMAGRLDPRPFGPADEVEVTADGEVVSLPSRNGYRRSIYMKHKRESLLTTLTAFDAPRLDDGNPNCLKRAHSTVATQALQLMNSELVRESSRYFAGRVIDAVGADPGMQVERVYLTALSRRPSAEERELGEQAIEDLTHYWLEHLEKEVPPEPKRVKAKWSALGTFCHTILNSPGFVYVD